MSLICFDDTPDGRAYASAYYDSFPPISLQTLMPLLRKHDHVCITASDTWYDLGDADFSTYAPYSITVKMGDKVNVNKL